jgi:hypothetical protein
MIAYCKWGPCNILVLLMPTLRKSHRTRHWNRWLLACDAVDVPCGMAQLMFRCGQPANTCCRLPNVIESSETFVALDLTAAQQDLSATWDHDHFTIWERTLQHLLGSARQGRDPVGVQLTMQTWRSRTKHSGILQASCSLHAEVTTCHQTLGRPELAPQSRRCRSGSSHNCAWQQTHFCCECESCQCSAQGAHHCIHRSNELLLPA